MYRILFTLIFSSLIAFNVSFAQDNIKEAREVIEENNRKLTAAMLEGNVEAMNEYYADDIIHLPSYEPMVRGKNKMIQKAKKEHESGFKFNSVKFNIIEVLGSGNHVYEIGEYDMTMVMPQMPQPVSDQGKYITIWEKSRDGKWKAVAEMWNSNNNPWGNQSDQQSDTKK